MLKGKLFNLYTSAVFGVTLAGYVQYMFLNGMMKSLNGTEDTRSTATRRIGNRQATTFILIIIPAMWIPSSNSTALF